MYEEFVADSAPIVDEFIRAVLVVDPAPYLADLDKFVESIDEMVGNVEVAQDDTIYLSTRVMYFIGEYLIRLHRGTWQIDTVPFSRTFGHYVIQVPLDRDGLGTFSVSPSELASDYVKTPPPRRLRTGIQALVARIASTRRD